MYVPVMGIDACPEMRWNTLRFVRSVGVGTPTAALAVYVMLLGFVRLPLLVTLIVLAPLVAGVYVNVAVGVPLLMLTVGGVNVPPLAASLGVTTTVPVIAPFAPAGKFVDAVEAVPDVGPDKVISVAAESPAEKLV